MSLPDNTIGRALLHAATTWPDRRFLLTPDGSSTFAQTLAESDRVARLLVERGVDKGDSVGIMLPNCPEYVTSWFGISSAGAVEVSINLAYKGSALRHLLDDSGTRLVICRPENLTELAGVWDELPLLDHLVLVGDAAVPPGLSVPPRIRLSRLDDAVSGVGPPDREVSPIDLAQLAYTSGTTGRSKGVQVPHNRIVQTARDMAALRGVGPSDTLYTCLPLFHGNAKYHTVMPALVSGAAVALDGRFSASGFWDSVRGFGATQFNYLGVMIAILHDQPRSPRDGEHQLTLGWGAGAPRAIHTGFEERFGVVLLEGYGLTEAGTPLSNTRAERRIGSCGKPTAGYQVQLVDEYDSPVPVGEPGEIVIRPTRPYCTMLGYHGLPEATLSTFRNLWLHTGDLARQDEDGFFHFVDRSKDVIRRRGENISSQEIEAIVRELPEVLECAAVPVPSPVTEDDVLVVVHAEQPAEDLARRIHDHCVRTMPAFWVPSYVHLSAEPLPKTPTNKFEKWKLKQLHLHADTWDRRSLEALPEGSPQ